MNSDFWDKMRMFDDDAKRHHRPGQRITVDDVDTRLRVALVFAGLVWVMAFGGLAYAGWWPVWWVAFVLAGIVFAWLFWVELEDAKDLQRWNPNAPTEHAAPPNHVITAELKTPAGLQFAEFEVSHPRNMTNFARRVVISGQSFSEATAKSAGITQTQFKKITKQFVNLQWAYWKNPTWHRAGVALTDSGISWLEKTAGIEM